MNDYPHEAFSWPSPPLYYEYSTGNEYASWEKGQPLPCVLWNVNPFESCELIVSIDLPSTSNEPWLFMSTGQYGKPLNAMNTHSQAAMKSNICHSFGIIQMLISLRSATDKSTECVHFILLPHWIQSHEMSPISIQNTSSILGEQTWQYGNNIPRQLPDILYQKESYCLGTITISSKWDYGTFQVSPDLRGFKCAYLFT